MDLEYFDESRQCPDCKIVTYCDRCPVCGKILPRSSYRSMKYRLFHGMEEEIRQPKNHTVHKSHRRERMTAEHPYQSADHMEPKLDISSAPSHTFRSVRKKRKKKSGKASIAVIMMVIAIISIIIGITEGHNEEDAQSHDDSTGIVQELKPKSEQNKDQEAIQVSEYKYDEEKKESILTIQNRVQNAYLVDIVLYDEEDQEISKYEKLAIFPYEHFDLSIFSETVANSYELKNCVVYEIGSTKPDISYRTYQGEGTIDVDSEQTMDEADLEILVRYLYEANEKLMSGDLYSIYVYMPDTNSYEVYLDQKKAECYLIDEDNDVVSTFDFFLGEEEIEESSF